MTEPKPAPRATASTWAPWWVYLIVILGAHYLQQAVMPYATMPVWAVVIIALAISAVLFVLITAIYRAIR